MAGAYCAFCGHRCFVYRTLPKGAQIGLNGWTGGHMATCQMGALNDMVLTGYDHATAHNPLRQTTEGGQ